MRLLAILIAAAIGYFLGSINFSIPVVKMFLGKDIRTLGSNNAGLTNTFRCAGKKCAIFTLIGDLSKGIIAVGVSRWICGLLNAGLSPDNDTHYIGYIAGLFAILGHVFPIYFGFKGGKGVATSLGVVLMLDWKVGLIVAVCAIAIMAITRYVSLGSILGGAAYIVVEIVKAIVTKNYNVIQLVCVVIIGGLLIARHHANIKRLLSGTENKLSFGKKEK